jgi:hypothetical protein
MKRFLLGNTLLALVSFAASVAFADVISVPTQFSSLQVGGVYTVAGDLTIQNGGSILCNDPAAPSGASACDIKIVVSGNMTMETSSAILAENNVASGSGGNIEITVAGDFVMQAGTKISSSDNTGGGTTGDAGNVTITVGTAGTPPTGTFTMDPGSSILADSVNRSGGTILINVAKSADVDGLVESFGGMSGTGASQPPGGGPITIDAGCDLIVSDTGKVSSRGRDPGADLVHLEGGCVVNIYGLVESTGVGHALNAPNHCKIAGKPTNSTACVEIVGGNSVTIDATGSHNGEVNADTGGPGGSEGTGWIDIYSKGPISIIGNVVAPFAVHANGNAGTNDVGGFITVKSRDATVLATGLALQTDALGAGGSGGRILVEAAQLINLDTARIFSRGDLVATGGYGKGGSVAIRSFVGSLSWQNGIGDVRPTGATIAAGSRGVIQFFDCNGGAGVDTSFTSFPSIGAATTPIITNPGACGGQPVIPLPLPDCVCGGGQTFQACISVTKFCTDAAAFGEPINFQGDVTNSCNDPLSNVEVNDDHTTPSTVLGPTTLAPGQSKHYSGQYVPTESPSTNTVTATGKGDNTQQDVSATASATCTMPAATGEGCTPGYWKNHPEAWASTSYVTTQLVNQVFTQTLTTCTSLGNKTLLQALSLQGGNTFCQKVEILLRAGVAAVLNASSGGVSYPMTTAEVITAVNNAIASGDSSTVTTVAKQLDDNNNLGCPLN